MFIVGLGTANPPKRYTQQECWEALTNSSEFDRLTTRSKAILKKVLLGQNGIVSRHLALDPLSEAFDLCPDSLHRRFLRTAPALAEASARRALGQSGLGPSQVDAIIVCTCTGYLCPGLTSYAAERLGLRSNIRCIDLVGQGCGAAMPMLQTADAMISSGQCKRILCIAVEVCSAAFYLDNDPGVLISACLFGDGAAAVVVSKERVTGQRPVRWKSSHTSVWVEDRDYLKFEQRNGMLRNILTPQVPELAAKHTETVLSTFLAANELRKENLAGWILHAGGRDVLDSLTDRLQLYESDIALSRRVLRDYGNMSSPFVLFVLQQVLEERKPGGLWWMSSFGAGFSSHGALLEVGL